MIWLVPLVGAAVALGFAGQGGSPATEGAAAVRRVCVQMGVQTYAAPDRRARIARSTATRPARLGGGSYVRLTGERAGGYVQVGTPQGELLWIPEAEPGSGAPSLCQPPSNLMRVCATAADDTVPVVQDFANPSSPPVAFLARGGLVRVWGYFEDKGRWTFVEQDDRLGFVRSESLCLETSRPPAETVTRRFAMTVAPASPECYQSHRERGADEIRRIVIHNSENTIKSLIGTFQSCNPDVPTSAHVGIDRDGRMYRFVEDRFSAFHTGANNGGFNSISLGIELVAYDKPGLTSMTPEQERALVALVRFWSEQYHIDIPRPVLENSSREKAYYNLEYWQAPVTMHRLVSAGRGTDCPTFVWPDNAQGDEAFFRWRQTHLGPPAPRPSP